MWTILTGAFGRAAVRAWIAHIPTASSSRGEWRACFGRRFGGSGGGPEVLLRGQSSERPMGPERVEVVGEGVDAAVHLHEVIVVDLLVAASTHKSPFDACRLR